MSEYGDYILAIKERGKKADFPFKEHDFVLLYRGDGTLLAIGDVAKLPAKVSVDKYLEIIKPEVSGRTVFTWTDVEEAYMLAPKNLVDWGHIKKHFFEDRKMKSLDEDEEYYTTTRLSEKKRILLVILKQKANVRYSTYKGWERARLR